MNYIKNIFLKPACAAAASLLLASCSTQKERTAELSLPDNFRNAAPAAEADTINTSSRLSYKDFFQDPVLVGLIDKALSKNNDLLFSIKQIEIASLSYSQTKWALLPRIDATIASASINRPSDNSLNGLSASQFLGQKYVGDFNTNINISWEADIWGKIKGNRKIALADYLQTQEATKAIKTRLVSEVAQGYYNLLMLDKQLEITQSNLAFSDSTLVILKKQQELGMITSLAVQQQEIIREQVSKNIPFIESAINRQENALSILAGEMPTAVERKSSLDEIVNPTTISQGIPMQLLENRPDVKGSELAFVKSTAAINVAKVSMYPALTLTAQGGLNSFKASNWFNIPGSLFGIVAGAIAQPILNGKQLKTRYMQSKIMSEQAELKFKQTVLLAAGEVSDALISIEKLEEQQKINAGLVYKSENAIQNSMTLFKYDMATYIEVIAAQTNKLQAELDLARTKAERLNAITTLYRSLGGGWQ